MISPKTRQIPPSEGSRVSRETFAFGPRLRYNSAYPHLSERERCTCATPAQEAAIQAGNRELLVSAAAGGGKTAVLVERIVRLIVERGASIDRMLIVTFTRAAAKGKCANAWKHASMRPPRAIRAWSARLTWSAPRKSPQFIVIASRVVRQNFQRCGVDPQFMLADEACPRRLLA